MTAGTAALAAPVNRRRNSAAAGLLLLGLLALMYHDVIFLGRSLVHSNYYNPFDFRALPANYGNDLVPLTEWKRRNLSQYANIRDPGATWWQWEPSTVFLREAMRTREWPLWDPYVAGGAPAMANLVPAFFFPPYTGVVALGASVALRNAYFLALLWAAAFFTYLFLQRHGLSAVASLTGGTLVLLSGGLNQNIGSFMGQTACCLPLAAYATRVFLDRPSARRVAGLAVVYASVSLASFPPLLVAIFGIVALYALTAIMVEQQRWTTRLRHAAAWAGAAACALGLAAFYYGPALALRHDAPQVALLYHEAAKETMPLGHIFQMLSPTVHGGVQIYLNGPFANQQGPHIPYVGGVAILCALLARRSVSPRTRALWITCTVASVGILLKLFGVPPLQWIAYVAPFNQIHMAWYFGVPLGFLVAVLAALGVDSLLRGVVRVAPATIAAGVVMSALGVLLIVSVARGVFATPVAAYVTRDWLVVAVVTAAASVAVVLATRLHATWHRRLAVSAVLALAIGEGIYNNRYPHPRRWDVYDHPVPYVQFLKQEAGRGRMLGFGVPYANLNSAFDIFGVDSLNAFNPPRMFAVYRKYTGAPVEAFFREAKQLPPEPLLDRAHVAFVSTYKGLGDIEAVAAARGYQVRFNDGFIVVYERPTLPRFFYSSEYRVATHAEALDAVAIPSPPREIVLESPPGIERTANQPADPDVTVESYRRNSVIVTIDAPRAGLVYASESFFPGWSARVNGAETTIHPANFAFRAVAVPAGRSRIEFHYWPSGLSTGLLVSSASLLVALSLLIARRSPSPAASTSHPPGPPQSDQPALDAHSSDTAGGLPPRSTAIYTEAPTVLEQPPLSPAASLVPPPELLFDGSSSTAEFVRIGDAFCRHILVERAHLSRDGALLDVGSGNGSIARSLTTYFDPAGRYEGLDIHRTAVDWLSQHYAPYPNFRFTHADVYNTLYNAAASSPASTYRFPFDDGSFDMVLMKSVFTHMLPADLGNYLNETARVLRPGGRAVITFFLLNEESRSYIDAGLDQMGLRHLFEDDPLCRVGNPDLPESVVAHDESRIRRFYSHAGFSIAEVTYGDWCGRRSLLGLQDVVIAIKN